MFLPPISFVPIWALTAIEALRLWGNVGTVQVPPCPKSLEMHTTSDTHLIILSQKLWLWRTRFN